MKALMYLGLEKLEIVEMPIPAGEVLIKVLYSGICGTDLKTYLHGHHFFKPPVILGHECIGEVVQVTAKNTSLIPGDFVAAAPYIECGTCDMCVGGIPELCTDKSFLKTGCFCEYIAVDNLQAERNIYKISAGDPVYSLVEPLACVLNGMNRLNSDKGQEFLVVGGGPMGTLFAAALTSLGKNVSVIEPSDWRYSWLRENHANEVFSNREEVTGRFFDGIILAANVPELVGQYLPFVREGGSMLLFGGYAKDVRVTIDPYHIHYREVSLSGCTGFSKKHFEKALQMIRNDKGSFDSLITHYYPLEESQNAFTLLKAGVGMKAVIRMSYGQD